MADGFVELTQEKLKSNEGIAEINRMLQFLFNSVAGDGEKQRVFYGYGSPEGVVVAEVGSLYMRTDGSGDTSTYKKASGSQTATGWVTIVAGTGSGAPLASSYVVVSSDGDLTAERVITAGSNVTLTDAGANSTITVKAVPSGSDTQVQFNDNGVFGGDSGFVFNKTSNHAAIGGGTIDQDFNIDGGDQTNTCVLNARETITTLDNSASAIIGELTLNPSSTGTADYLSGVAGSLVTSSATAFNGQFFPSGVFGQFIHDGSSTTLGFNVAAIRARGTNTGSGKISNAVSLFIEVPENDGAGDITAAAGIYITSSSNGGNDPTNQYGLLIDPITDGTSISRNIYSSGSNSGGSSSTETLTIHKFEGAGGFGGGIGSSLNAILEVDGANTSSVTVEKVQFQSSARTLTISSGSTVANQRVNKFLAPTINGVAGGGTETVTDSATVYIDNAPSGSNITLTNAYSLWVDAGTARFDGNGTYVFELPADATDPTAGGGAAAGRIPINIGGATKYLAYY